MGRALAKWIAAFGALAAATLASGSGFAQARGDKAAAEVLFEDARKLVKLGRYADACPKFAESSRLDPGIGVLLYLGDCYEKNGQLASAWATFREAGPAARDAGQADREAKANERARALEPRLSYITIVVAPEAAALGVEVRRDGVPVGRPLWGTAVPVDNGEHRVEAVAPGRKKWATVTRIDKDASRVSISVPALEAEAAGAAPAGPAAPSGTQQPAPAPSTSSSMKTAGLVVGGVGLAGLVVGGIFGALTFSTYGDAKGACTPGQPLRCPQDALDQIDAAKTMGLVSTVGFVVGGAGVVGGLTLWFTAPSSSTATGRVTLTPEVGHASAGVRLRGSL